MPLKSNRHQRAFFDISNSSAAERNRAATMRTTGAWSDDILHDYAMSPALAKFTGLYYVVDPKPGRRRDAARAVAVALIAFAAGCLTLCPFGIYRWSNDVTQLIIQFVILGNFSFGCYKAYRLVRRADDVRRCVEIARVDLAHLGEDGTSGDADGYLRSGRRASSRFVRWFALYNYGVLFAWTALPFAVGGDQRVMIRNRDGTTTGYRCNPYNMYFAVSADTYNRWVGAGTTTRKCFFFFLDIRIII